MNVIVVDDYDAVSSEAFKIVKEVLKKENPVLGLATGSSPVGLYKKMIADHNSAGTSYDRVRTWNLDEYIGISHEHDQSYWTFMHENLFNGIGIPAANVHVPVGDAEDEEEQCRLYEESMKDITVDLQILGIGANGHIGFNEPGTPFDSLTHIVDLTEQTREDNKRFFNDDLSQVPARAITMGLATIMRSRKIVLIATGEHKAQAIRGIVEGEISPACPASILRNHSDVTVIVDRSAAQLLSI